jgi:PAS domain S-box-containing protein
MRSPDREEDVESPSLASLEQRLHTVSRERDRLRSELEMRNCALDAATSYFLIAAATKPWGQIVYANVALARDYGYDRAELIGASPEILVPLELNGAQYERIAAATRAGESLRVELRARRKDGSEFSTGVSLNPVRDAHGRVTHYVSIAADITARLREEQNRRELQEKLSTEMRERERIALELRLSQKLEAVGQLAAGIAHEINTPIQYVGDSIDFLRQAATDCWSLLDLYRDSLTRLATGDSMSGVRERVDAAERDVDLPFLLEEVPRAFERTLAGISRVAEIVRAMKEFARPDAGVQVAADINHAVETTLTVARNEYKYVAEVQTSLGEIPEVVCNIGELNQVLLNLIVNAAHAIADAGKDSRTGRIAVSTAISGASVIVTVEDNGCGIPEQNLERIFDPFFTTKEVGRGTGQGLAIARSIVVDKHGGTLRAESTVGAGARFTVSLPIAGQPKGAAR